MMDFYKYLKIKTSSTGEEEEHRAVEHSSLPPSESNKDWERENNQNSDHQTPQHDVQKNIDDEKSDR